LKAFVRSFSAVVARGEPWPSQSVPEIAFEIRFPGSPDAAAGNCNFGDGPGVAGNSKAMSVCSRATTVAGVSGLWCLQAAQLLEFERQRDNISAKSAKGHSSGAFGPQVRARRHRTTYIGPSTRAL